ncbi:TetR/AcrR family transcriptional regulator [Cellulomonas endophytica]|uniref:TetR/AcrR family transcriptional regulator n=1 Tax=Cellulomonas endophytica TaxID=2494735 RepID=UPI0010118738|nr:TetR/AcrR family transcriptional regulator [Cellulomonas endophytica]
MPRPKSHDEALRARLLAEATDVVAQGGSAALTVRDVAARVGTSASAVYALFGSREDLVRAVGRSAQDAFAARLAQVPATGDARADLLALGLAYRAHALDAPHAYRAMFEAAVPAADRPEPTGTASFSLLRAAVARTLPDAPSPAHLRIALDLWALVHGAVSLELSGLLPGEEAERADRYADLLAAAGPGVVALGLGGGTGTVATADGTGGTGRTAATGRTDAVADDPAGGVAGSSR